MARRFFSEVEVDEKIWKASTESAVELGTFLREKEGSDGWNPLGKFVTVVLRGLQAQHLVLKEKLQEQQPDVDLGQLEKPKWWSIHHLAQRELDANASTSLQAKAQRQMPPRFAQNEVCQIVGISWHKRLVVKNVVADAVNDCWFVRLRLQRCRAVWQARLGHLRSEEPCETYTMEPWVTSMEFHLDAECDFIVPRDKYITHVLQAKWKAGEPCWMLWADPDNPAEFEFYRGKILREMPFDPNKPDPWDPNKESLWEQFEIRWDNGEVTMVNAWEIRRRKERQRLPSRGAYSWRPHRLAADSGSDADSIGDYWDLGTEVEITEGDEEEEEDDQEEGEEWDEDTLMGVGRARGRRRAGGRGRNGEGAAEALRQGRGRRPASQGRRQSNGGAGPVGSQQQQQVGPSAEDIAAASAAAAEQAALTERRQHNNPFCGICLDGGQLRPCDGPCMGAFHPQCLPVEAKPGPQHHLRWLCPACTSGAHVCAACGHSGAGILSTYAPSPPSSPVVKCSALNCGLHWHVDCVSAFTLRCSSNQHGFGSAAAAGATAAGLVCPAHTCHTCGGKDERSNLLRCWLCPRAYHGREACLPAQAAKLQPAGLSGVSSWVWCPECLACHQQCCREAAEGDRGQTAVCWPGCDATLLKQRIRQSSHGHRHPVKGVQGLDGSGCAKRARLLTTAAG